MRKQLTKLRGQLERAWTRDGWSATRRREVLFTLWDDCDETPNNAGDNPTKTVEATLDQARAKAGTQARKQIVAFIREELPSGSADAYPLPSSHASTPPATAKQRFAPYD